MEKPAKENGRRSGRKMYQGSFHLSARIQCPFVEAVGPDQTALGLEGVAEGRFAVRLFGPGIEHRTLGNVLRPPRDEPPSSFAELVIALLAGEHKESSGNRLSRSNAV
jgi:hypothetical protein